MTNTGTGPLLRSAIISAFLSAAASCAPAQAERAVDPQPSQAVLEASAYTPSHHLTFPSYFYSFGDGSGGGRLQLLLQNPGPVPATATVRFLSPDTDRPIDVVTTARSLVVQPGQAVISYIGRTAEEQYAAHGPDYEMRFDTRVDSDQPIIGVISASMETANGSARAALENAPRTATPATPYVPSLETSRMQILSATYGRNCFAPFGNVTAALRAECDGMPYCMTVLAPALLGADPAPGCAKTLEVEYVCSGSSARTFTAPAEAQGRMLDLDCDGFSDVPRTHPFFRQISLATARGYGLPCATSPRAFCPDTPITRGEVATMVMRALYGPRSRLSNTQRFTDVPPWHPHFATINRFSEIGLTAGCGPGLFCPDRPITRGEMSVFIVRAMQIRAGLPFEAFSYPTTPYFTDVPASHPFFRFVQRFRSLGITSGCSINGYCVDSPTTRGQLAVFLTRALP